MEKYTSWSKFYFVKSYRGLLRLFLAPLISWKKLTNPKPGYTISIASHWRFPHMLEACLMFLSQQDLTHMDCVICSIDSSSNTIWTNFEKSMKQRFPNLKLKFSYQTLLQSKLLRIINWGWIDCWLSFCKGIGESETRYVLLHDNDAMLLDRTFIETRYRLILERKDIFLSGRWYRGNGLDEGDHLASTPELILDAQFIRDNCSPIECFNHICVINGKRVDLDLLLHCQLKTDKRSIEPINFLEQWIHPTQVISQYTYLARGKGWVPPKYNNLFFIPYFEYLGGASSIIQETIQSLNSTQGHLIKFLGYEMDISNMDHIHMNWIRAGIERLEQYLFGFTREEIEIYLQAIEVHVPGNS